ncbi:MAG: hypothetical protein Q9174_007088 [Haloplaca sp. 1 TL-2023]
MANLEDIVYVQFIVSIIQGPPLADDSSTLAALMAYMNEHGGEKYARVAVQNFAVDMLGALDFLTTKEIIHRDIKPANILYPILPDSSKISYNFQLGDFGLSDRRDDALTVP